MEADGWTRLGVPQTKEPKTDLEVGMDCDVLIYGGTSAGIAAAVQTLRMGLHPIVVEPSARIGGLTTGGLGQTDIGNKEAFGGIALEFYRGIREWYDDPRHWKFESAADYFPDGQCAGTCGRDAMWTFEPSAALAVLEGWEKHFALDIRRGERLRRPGGAIRRGGRIVAAQMESGLTLSAKVFIDATYEGDLMAEAGVSYTIGREPNSLYGETLNGIQRSRAEYHQFFPGVDPFVVKGDPASGLLPGVEPFDPAEQDGHGDRRVQAYCFRMCLTDVPENRIPFAKPEGYDERDYELLFRDYEQRALHPEEAVGYRASSIGWLNSRMPCRKTDTNNRQAFSSDFIGRSAEWPEASYSRREVVFREHLAYQRGLMWTLANHPRIPEKVRAEVSRWGTCKDEFLSASDPGGGWPGQLYVREARRMVGEQVVTEDVCAGRRDAPRPVALGAYNFDSHHVRRCVGADGFVHNEGDIEIALDGHPYGIPYGALVPRRAECENLLVPVCLSASHIAYGSIRMEPCFFALGQAAGTAAALAAAASSAVQDIDYGALSRRLESDGQRFHK